MPEKPIKFCNFCGKSEDKVQSIFTAGASNIWVRLLKLKLAERMKIRINQEMKRQ